MTRRFVMQKSARLPRQRTPSQATTIVMSPKRPVFTLLTVDYSTQGDPDQVAPPANNAYNQNNSTTAIQNTNNYLVPDGSDRTSITYKTKHSTQVYWKMDIMLIWWNFKT